MQLVACVLGTLLKPLALDRIRFSDHDFSTIDWHGIVFHHFCFHSFIFIKCRFGGVTQIFHRKSICFKRALCGSCSWAKAIHSNLFHHLFICLSFCRRVCGMNILLLVDGRAWIQQNVSDFLLLYCARLLNTFVYRRLSEVPLDWIRWKVCVCVHSVRLTLHTTNAFEFFISIFWLVSDNSTRQRKRIFRSTNLRNFHHEIEKCTSDSIRW